MHLDQLNLGSAKSIVTIATLPTGATTYPQWQLLKVTDKGGRLYRTTKPNADGSVAGDIELFSTTEYITVAAVGGSASSKVGDTVAGVTLASGDMICVGGATPAATAIYSVGAAASTLVYTLDVSQIVNTFGNAVYMFNAHATSGDGLTRLDNVAANYNASLTPAATVDYTKNYQVLNGNVTIDVSLMSAAADIAYEVRADADLKVTFTNGTLEDKSATPLCDAAGGTFVNLRNHDKLVFRKVSANKVSIGF